MSKRASKFALMSIVGGFVLMFAAIPPAHAQQGARPGGARDQTVPAAGAAAAAERGTGLTTDGARKLGAGLGVGFVAIGAGIGIGRIGGSATDSGCRAINNAMIITAALIEGVALFGLVIDFLVSS